MPSIEDTAAARNLVLCFDGTSNKPGEKITNVLRLFQALNKNDEKKQLCYYQPGIGMEFSKPIFLTSQADRSASIRNIYSFHQTTYAYIRRVAYDH